MLSRLKKPAFAFAAGATLSAAVLVGVDLGAPHFDRDLMPPKSLTACASLAERSHSTE